MSRRVHDRAPKAIAERDSGQAQRAQEVVNSFPHSRKAVVVVEKHDTARNHARPQPRNSAAGRLIKVHIQMRKTPAHIAVGREAFRDAARNEGKTIRFDSVRYEPADFLRPEWCNALSREAVVSADTHLLVEIGLQKALEGIEAVKASIVVHKGPDHFRRAAVLRAHFDVVAFGKVRYVAQEAHEVSDAQRIQFLDVVLGSPFRYRVEPIKHGWVTRQVVGHGLQHFRGRLEACEMKQRSTHKYCRHQRGAQSGASAQPSGSGHLGKSTPPQQEKH